MLPSPGALVKLPSRPLAPIVDVMVALGEVVVACRTLPSGLAGVAWPEKRMA